MILLGIKGWTISGDIPDTKDGVVDVELQCTPWCDEFVFYRTIIFQPNATARGWSLFGGEFFRRFHLRHIIEKINREEEDVRRALCVHYVHRYISD